MQLRVVTCSGSATQCVSALSVKCVHWIQVAEQQGKYLAKAFNKLAKDPSAKIAPFNYKHMGSMASIGRLHMA